MTATKSMKYDGINRMKRKIDAEESEDRGTNIKLEGDRDKPELDTEKQIIRRKLW